MRILVTLISLLIAGMLSSTIAYSTISPVTPSHLALLGFVNTTIEDVEKFDRELCGTNGGPNAFKNQNESINRFERCYNSVKQEALLAIGMTSGSVMGSREFIYFREYCRRIPSIGNCIKNLTDSMKTCLDVKKHESADVVYNTAIELMKFICEDFTVETMLKSFNFLECAQSNQRALEQCANQTFVKYIHATVPDGAAIGGLGSFHLLVPDVTKCTVFEKFQDCAIKGLHNCTSSSVDLATSLLNVVKKTTTCDHLLKSQAASARVVDIALITAVIAMSLRLLYA